VRQSVPPLHAAETAQRAVPTCLSYVTTRLTMKYAGKSRLHRGTESARGESLAFWSAAVLRAFRFWMKFLKTVSLACARSVGLAARQNGPVACPPQISTAWFRFRSGEKAVRGANGILTMTSHFPTPSTFRARFRRCPRLHLRAR
jgi:hypothetical protein